MRLLATAALALALAAPAAAQLRVTASAPADGAVAVPLTTTLALTFSEAVAGPPSVAFLPADSIDVGEPAISGDGRTVTYPVVHTASTRFVHLVLGAEAVSGAALERPFAVAYTTAPTAGGYTVTGRVTAEAGSADATLVVLVGLGAGGTFVVADAAVLTGTAGTYSLGPVPFAIYTVGAVRLPHDDPARTFAYGFYDTNNDGTPDPVILPFNVNLTIREPQPATARARAADAAAAAQGQAPDALLFALPETPVGPDGRAPLWSYAFYSPAQDSTITVLGTPLLPFAVTTPGGPPAQVPIPEGWVDSDVALAAAEAAGGAAFRAAHAGEPQTLTARGGLYPDVPTDATPAWTVAYRATGGDSLVVYVHMGTGDVIGTTAAEPGAGQDGLALEAPAPNPAAGPVTVAYRLDAPGHVRLAVFDALGREVAVLDEGVRAAGRHVVAWHPVPGQAAGAYLLRLDAAGGIAVRTLARTR